MDQKSEGLMKSDKVIRDIDAICAAIKSRNDEDQNAAKKRLENIFSEMNNEVEISRLMTSHNINKKDAKYVLDTAKGYATIGLHLDEDEQVEWLRGMGTFADGITINGDDTEIAIAREFLRDLFEHRTVGTNAEEVLEKLGNREMKVWVKEFTPFAEPEDIISEITFPRLKDALILAGVYSNCNDVETKTSSLHEALWGKTEGPVYFSEMHNASQKDTYKLFVLTSVGD